MGSYSKYALSSKDYIRTNRTVAITGPEAMKEQIQRLLIVTISDNSKTDAIHFGQSTANDGSQQLPRLETHEDKCC